MSNNEKTGGTSARMEPGSERGGVRIQRRPNLKGQPTKELEKLLKQAIGIATMFGFVPEVWNMNAEGNAAQIRCKETRRLAAVACHPMRGREQIHGDIVENRR